MCYTGKCPHENYHGDCVKGGQVPCPHEQEEPGTDKEEPEDE